MPRFEYDDHGVKIPLDLSKAPSDYGSRPGEVVGYKVEYTNPEEVLGRKALQLAQALADAELHEKQAVTYAEQANAERGRATELLAIAEQIRRDPSRKSLVSTSRMDPMRTYDLSAIVAEASKHQQQARDFDHMSEEFRVYLEQAREDSRTIQADIQSIRNRR